MKTMFEICKAHKKGINLMEEKQGDGLFEMSLLIDMSQLFDKTRDQFIEVLEQAATEQNTDLITFILESGFLAHDDEATPTAIAEVIYKNGDDVFIKVAIFNTVISLMHPLVESQKEKLTQKGD